MLKRKEKLLQNFNKGRNMPEDLENDQKVFVKVTQRVTKDKEPFKIATVQENNELTFKDTHGFKIHKARIKK